MSTHRALLLLLTRVDLSLSMSLGLPWVGRTVLANVTWFVATETQLLNQLFGSALLPLHVLGSLLLQSIQLHSHGIQV